MARQKRGWSPMMWFLVGGGFLITIALSKASETMGAWSIPIWLAAIAGVAYVLRGPFGETVLQSIANHDREPEQLGAHPEVLQELDDLRAHMNELQERLDFTERMLARERDARTLATGEKP